MSNTKHTPDIWESKEEGIYAGGLPIATAFVNTSKRYIGKKEAKANAKLMAAAPELLAALKSLAGIECWIGDTKMKQLFQSKVYPAIEKATK